MKNFQRAMLALDLSAMDKNILQYIALLSSILDLRKIYVVHAIPNFAMPENVDVEFHKLFNPEYPIDEKIRDKIALDIQEVFGQDPEIDFNIEVIEGKPYEKLIHWTKIKEIDLLVVGRKDVSEGSGITPRRVARKTECNVLFVPMESVSSVKRIMVPIDFSDNSLRALQRALAIKAQLPETIIQCVYVVDMPPADYYMRPFDNSGYRQVLLDSARNANQRFLEENELQDKALLETAFIPNEYSNIAAHLNEFIEKNDINLIIMGAQGHNAFEQFIYGSVTERLVERCKHKPVLIVR